MRPDVVVDGKVDQHQQRVTQLHDLKKKEVCGVHLTICCNYCGNVKHRGGKNGESDIGLNI